ncbi:hypothetical protein ABIG06_002755 [Bradyrhizobium sp. USDA 326]|uniref:hypothetical protein n=1 Tax=unclassified Bradyrhizobium TaxID=2631580 RepID=UPI003519287D
MKNRMLLVEPIGFDQALLESFDLGVGIIGYEARAPYCPTKFSKRAKRNIALRYMSNSVRSYGRNDLELKDLGFLASNLRPDSEALDAEEVIQTEIARIADNSPRLVVDISSMSRKTMAGIFAAIMGSRKRRVEVVFTYAVAAFEPPPREYPPLIEFGAVSNVFGGAPRGANKPTALILGLGYEAGRAISAYSQMEADEAWMLMPVNRDPRYNDAVKASNRELLTLSEKINCLNYDIYNPVFLYEKIRTLALGLRTMHRLVFIPSGPKLCALMTFLVALDLYPDVSVWRMSSGPLEPLFHRVASGETLAVKVIFEREAELRVG